MALFSSRLRKASYDGVSFEVSSSEVSFGRRTVTHEYPQRDTPYTEDLGRLKRTFQITGFVIGDDYIAHAKRLMEHLESGGGEAKKLVHPWLGTLKVYVIDTPKVSWDAQKRVCTFQLSFVESGELENPSASQSWGAKLRSSVDAWADSLSESLGITWKQIDDLTEFTDEIASGQFMDILGCLGDCKFVKFFDLGNSILNLTTTAAAALSSGAEGFTKALFRALGVGGFTSSYVDWGRASDSVKAVVNDKRIKADNTAITVWNTNKKDLETRKTQLATSVKEQVRNVLLIQMAGCASMIGTSMDTSAASRSDEEVLKLRNDMLEALENEMLYLEHDPTFRYEYVEDCYHCLYRYLTDEVMQGSNDITVTPSENEPAVVVAYNATGDASKVEELVYRNRIPFPLFLEKKSLKISG